MGFLQKNLRILLFYIRFLWGFFRQIPCKKSYRINSSRMSLSIMVFVSPATKSRKRDIGITFPAAAAAA